MILQTFLMHVHDGVQADYERLFEKWRNQIKAEEPGTLRFDLYRQASDPTRYLVIQAYESVAALETHAANMVARGVPEEGAHLPASAPVMTVYEPVIVD